jgi:ribose-phosphate pyrophosphokinase
MIKQILSYNKQGAPNEAFKSWFFPSGEIGFKLLNPESFENAYECCIKTRLIDSNSIMELVMATDALRRVNPGMEISLLTPIIPYARQDRVCVNGESFSLEVFANILNSLNFSNVTTFEPHSQVCFDKIERLRKIDLDKRVKNYIPWEDNFMLVSPDKGAIARVNKLNETLGGAKIAVANKVRDLTNGNIIGMELEGDVNGKNVLVFDDLVDGGRTFIELHKLLKDKGAAQTMLFVVHGIFSKGIECITNLYDFVVTTNTYQDFDFDRPNNFRVFTIY